MALLKLILSHAEWLPGVRLRHFSTTCAVYIEGCEDWWLSGWLSGRVLAAQARCPGFNSRRLPAFSLFFIIHPIIEIR